jgi:hypothetical protein
MLRSLFPRSVALLCVLTAIGVGLSGCVFMSDEDRDFYGKGWVNPKELDQQPHHTVPNPDALPLDPDESSTAASSSSGHPSASSDEWTSVPPLQ